MNILITGITGYLGKSLIEEFRKTDVKLTLTYRKKKIKFKKEKVSWKKFDIRSKIKNCYDYFDKPKTMVHLAWEGLSERNYNSRVHKDQVNYHFRFIKSLIQNGLKNIIIIGTCFEYGDYDGELKENLKPNPKTKYGLAKNELRNKLEKLKLEYDFNLTWLRIFYFYGGKKKSNDIWGSLNHAVQLKKKKFKITEGTQLRDYLHIKKICKYIKTISLLKKNCGIINVCSNKPISIKSITAKWIKEFNWDIKIENSKLPFNKYEPKNFWGSNKKLKNLLKFK